MTKLHVEPPLKHRTKGKYDGKSDKDFVKMRLCRDTMESTSDLYDINMYLFDNVQPEEFLLFLRNFNMTLAASGTPETDVNVKYLHTLVCERRYISLTCCLMTWKVRTP